MGCRPALRATALLLLATSAYAATPSSAAAAFGALKSLEGTWSIQSAGKTLPITMVYEAGSKGSILTERFGKELSVFYQDHQTLMMIHFCNAGNQPRLRLSESSVPGVLQFEAVEVTNLARPGAAHVQRILYKIVDPNKFDLEIVWTEDRTETSEKYNLVRSQTAAERARKRVARPTPI